MQHLLHSVCNPAPRKTTQIYNTMNLSCRARAMPKNKLTVYRVETERITNHVTHTHTAQAEPSLLGCLDRVKKRKEDQQQWLQQSTMTIFPLKQSSEP